MKKIMMLSSLVLLLLCSYSTVNNAREITHEDIKDAMLSLVHMMRENTEKLERHEVRERQLGEYLKKTISIITKRLTSVDGLKVQLAKLDERITGIEQLIAQRDERERIQMQKTSDALEDLGSRLKEWLTDIETKVTEANNQPDTTLLPVSKLNSDILLKLNNTESLLIDQIAHIELNLILELKNLKVAITHESDKLRTLIDKVWGIDVKIKDIQNALEKMKEDLFNLLEKPQDLQLRIISIIEKQTGTLGRVQELLKNIVDHIEELPRTNEVQTLHNETHSLLEETKHTLKNTVLQEINDIRSQVLATKEDTIDTLRMDLANNANRVSKELHDLSKGQSVMVSMADHVLDIKKRVEYGVHQILLEVGDLVKAQSKNINNTINTRFNGISNDIMDNQNGALANLTSKMEQEMNQVWRQINVMYQQMTESAKALDKLHKQNEAYVSGTTSTMDGMENKVSEITKRMSEVDKNLNYLLGRLSLVTQEFNQIKTGLGTALDNIKASFKEVQEKANDLSHPGPHPVPENYKELDESENKKSNDNPLPEISHIFDPQSN